MKIIKVTSCADCPNDKLFVGTGCILCDSFTMAMEIKLHIANNTIHPDCPLEDGCDEKEVE
jgi:hypothetical protein